MSLDVQANPDGAAQPCTAAVKHFNYSMRLDYIPNGESVVQCLRSALVHTQEVEVDSKKETASVPEVLAAPGAMPRVACWRGGASHESHAH